MSLFPTSKNNQTKKTPTPPQKKKTQTQNPNTKPPPSLKSPQDGGCLMPLYLPVLFPESWFPSTITLKKPYSCIFIKSDLPVDNTKAYLTVQKTIKKNLIISSVRETKWCFSPGDPTMPILIYFGKKEYSAECVYHLWSKRCQQRVWRYLWEQSLHRSRWVYREKWKTSGLLYI